MIYKNPQPVLLDKAIIPLQESIAKIPWITNVYGRALRKVRNDKNGRKVYYPAVHVLSREHLSVAPSEGLGNFAFFDFPNGETYPDYHQLRVGKTEAQMRIIVWYKEDERKGTADHRERRKLDALTAIRNTVFPREMQARVLINRSYEQAEQIYRGYTIDETMNQFLMYPYGGFCLEGILQYEEPCLKTKSCCL